MNRFTIRLVIALGTCLALSASAQTSAPLDPKSPIPDCVDGRGPSGPVELKIVAPKADEVVPIPETPAGQPPAKGAVIDVKFELKNYETFLDAKTGCGQGVAIAFDNYPAAVHYDLTKRWAFPTVPKGTHTIRAFAVRPWGEALREAGAFSMVTFHVAEKDGKYAPDPKAPLLTVNRPRTRIPKGQKVLFDFLVAGCTVSDQSNPESCRVRYQIGELPEVTLTKPDPVWLADLPVGKHGWVMALSTPDGKIVPGPFSVARGTFEVIDPAATPAPPGAPAKAGAPTP